MGCLKGLDVSKKVRGKWKDQPALPIFELSAMSSVRRRKFENHRWFGVFIQDSYLRTQKQIRAEAKERIIGVSPSIDSQSAF